MGKNKEQGSPSPAQADTTKETEQNEGPERFDPALLQQPEEVRQDYFENDCIIEHARLTEACDAILQMICSPGEGPTLNRRGTMVLAIGPSRVGKSTLIKELEKRLNARATERMRIDPSHLPFVSITATGPGSGRFDWRDYYRDVLRQVKNPFLDHKKSGNDVRVMQERMEEALRQHQPYAVIVDEAHHLAKTSTGRTLKDHLDHIKDLENRTGVSHVLVGTYEMRPFRKVNAQLAGRSMDVHFSRYDVMKKGDVEEFQSLLWAMQRQMPLEEEPLLVENHWEYLYARSIGCIGLLKLHLNRALSMALNQEAKTVTEAHLRATATSSDRLEAMLNEALKGEADLAEPAGADEQLFEHVGLKAYKRAASQKKLPSSAPSTSGNTEISNEKQAPQTQKRKTRPGNRAEGRDPIGLPPDEQVLNQDELQEQVAG